MDFLKLLNYIFSYFASIHCLLFFNSPTNIWLACFVPFAQFKSHSSSMNYDLVTNKLALTGQDSLITRVVDSQLKGFGFRPQCLPPNLLGLPGQEASPLSPPF